MITPDELKSFDEEPRIEFEKLPEKYKLHPKRDLCGLLIMDMLFPDEGSVIGGADHDVVYMTVSYDAVMVDCTLDDLRALRACGIRIGQYDDLCMYV